MNKNDSNNESADLETKLSEAEEKLSQVEIDTEVKLGSIPFVAAMSGKVDPNG
ncbi:MAG: hypothetical protein K0V04_38080 [Deltaproteobacteria bacterium]|nr:hypothetical protein [Deltaproteobacteria bacterium]